MSYRCGSAEVNYRCVMTEGRVVCVCVCGDGQDGPDGENAAVDCDVSAFL